MEYFGHRVSFRYFIHPAHNLRKNNSGMLFWTAVRSKQNMHRGSDTNRRLSRSLLCNQAR